MFKVMFALLVLIFAISEAKAERERICMKVLYPEDPLAIGKCDDDHPCHWTVFTDVKQVEVLDISPGESWVKVQPNPPPFQGEPWSGWMHSSREGKLTGCGRSYAGAQAAPDPGKPPADGEPASAR
jgi:hypothetical protein